LAKRERSRWLALAPMLLIVLELIPGHERDVVRVRAMPWVRPATRLIAAQHAPSLLVLPIPRAGFQLHFVQTPIRLYSGYSGRIPVHTALLNRLARNVSNSEQCQALLDFVQPPLVATTTSSWQALVDETGAFESKGCRSGPDGEICVYAPLPQTRNRWQHIARLRLDRDAAFVYRRQGSRLTGELRATVSGTLDILQLATCHLQDCVKYPLIPETCRDERLKGKQLTASSYTAGDTILEWTSTREALSRSAWLRPRERFALRCPILARGTDTERM
jgi:hypothetical protein